VFGSYPSRTGAEARPVDPRPLVSVATPATPPVGDSLPAAVLEKKPYTLASRLHRAEDTVIHVAGVELGGAKPVVIAGPCSVESREQIRACARVVKELGGHVLRGGCFKPRTSPYSFQGLGYEALDLLREAGDEVGLPVVTEVMHPADVGPVAEKAQILQIGARNMQNFSLLKEVGKIDRPVMIKRGLMSSVDEWLGAAEYVLAQGNQMVFLCERGIRTFETSTRNTLDLGAVPVVKELTHLPVIVDPSHALGVARWVPPLAEAALAAGAHGLMVEIHPDPAHALSDGAQSLTFSTFEALMRRIGGDVS
jgi:3-deoxy-7-phosphoheptulonate synthase